VALGAMGPNAKEALPALDESLKDDKKIDFDFRKLVSEARMQITTLNK
jgi:hypothetical protein